jgi:hypothetical protein
MEFVSASASSSSSSSSSEMVEFFTFACEDHPSEGRDVDIGYIESNSVLKSIGIEFFQRERIVRDSIVEVVEMLRQGFEDGLISDEDLQVVMKFSDFSVLKFLLNAILKNLGTMHVLVRCLAFGGNIYEAVWSDFAYKSVHLLLLTHTTEHLLSSTLTLALFREKMMHRRSYHGFDKRDIKDFHMEGFEEEETELEQRRQAKADRHDQIMTMLLLVTQFYLQPIDLLSAYIENSRERKTHELEEDPELHEDTEYITECIVAERLPVIVDLVFDISHATSEDALQQSIKLLVALSQQYPNIRYSVSNAEADGEHDNGQHMGNYTELSVQFVRTDRERADGGVLQQTLLYILNENNFPKLDYMETIASLRFIINVLYSASDCGVTSAEKQQTESGSNRQPFQAGEEENDTSNLGNRGNFYLNDLKVLMEICLRELTNITRHSGERRWDSLRLKYVHVIQAVLEQTNWSRVADDIT